MTDRARCTRCGRPCAACQKDRAREKSERLAEQSRAEQAQARHILSAAANDWGTTVEAILGPSRSLKVYSARREAVRRLRYELQWSLKEIGFLLNRDHSTIIHSLKEKSA